MNKRFTVALAFIMIINIICGTAFAQETSETAEKAATEEAAQDEKALKPDSGITERLVTLVKSKINIPVGYDDFKSSVGNDKKGVIYNFTWSPNQEEGTKARGIVEVSVDARGIITRYYKYSDDYQYLRKFPSLSRERCFEISRKYIYYMCSDVAEEISFDEGRKSCTLEYEGNYSFVFNRAYKGIPYYENTISLSINGSTGEVISFERNWDESIVFPEPEKTLDLQAARKAYKESIPLILRYKGQYSGDISSAYLFYLPDIQDLTAGVDASTGKKLIAHNTDIYYQQGALYAYDSYEARSSDRMRDISLEEKALDELIEREGLITVEDAQELSEEMIGIDNTYNMASYNYARGDGKYTLTIEFLKMLSEKDFGEDVSVQKANLMIAAGEAGGVARVTLDAKSGEPVSINSYSYVGGKSEPEKDIDFKKAAEDFLKKYKAGKFSQSSLDTDAEAFSEYALKYGGIYPESKNSFTYVRRVHGIPFGDNRLNIEIDPVSGKVSGYNEVWSEMTEFASPENTVGTAEAYEALFLHNDLGLKYVVEYNTENIKLIYGPDFKKPICIDAARGILINYANSQPYKEAGELRYSDIEHSAAKDKIQALLEAGILPQNDKFLPQKELLQKEWLNLISRVGNRYYEDINTWELAQKQMDEMYRRLINEQVIDEREKNPDAVITREEAVKYLLNSAGYKRFAQLKDLFTCDFTDSHEVAPELLGYVAIAKSLKIAEGGNGRFMPKNNITRAEAAAMIYNYIKSQY